MLVTALAPCKPEVMCLKAAKKMFGGVVDLPGDCSAIITLVHTHFLKYKQGLMLIWSLNVSWLTSQLVMEQRRRAAR